MTAVINKTDQCIHGQFLPDSWTVNIVVGLIIVQVSTGILQLLTMRGQRRHWKLGFRAAPFVAPTGENFEYWTPPSPPKQLHQQLVGGLLKLTISNQILNIKYLLVHGSNNIVDTWYYIYVLHGKAIS